LPKSQKPLTTKDTKEHGGEIIAKIAGIAEESKVENLPQRHRDTEENGGQAILLQGP
jgi:hypothetical protein